MNEVKEKINEIKIELEKNVEPLDKYTILSELTPHGYFIVDPEGNILELNVSGSKMIGLVDKNAQRDNLFRYITHDTQAIFSEFLQKVFETRIKQGCKISFIDQKDPVIYNLISGISFEENSKCFLLAIEITDIDLLKTSAIRFRNLFESLKDGILILDADKGKITDVNKTLSELIGFDAEELMGKYVWEVPVFRDIVKSKEEIPDLENIIRNHNTLKNGNKTIEVEIVTNVYEFGNKKEVQLNFRDITERVQYQRDLEESKTRLEENGKRLEELNAAKDKFVSIMSHDLKSPFSSIIGFSELLSEKIEKEEYNDIKKYAEYIQKSSKTAMDLLSNLIEWSRSQNGRLDFNRECINFELLIDEALKYSLDAAEQKSITLINEVPGNLMLFVDKAMINTVMRNLISNAIKFTNSGGKVNISAIREKGHTMVSVKDNGIGMEPEIQEKLFQLGKSITTTGTKQETGTGLGLLLCKEFVEKHKGNIWVESKPGEGSVFNFTIPH